MKADMLKILAIQTELAWENTAANLDHFEHIINANSFSADLILLPEMFNTGFSMSALHLAEAPGGKSSLWMKKIAAEQNVVVCGSLMIEEGGKVYNRLIWQRPDGNYSHYNKRHLFAMTGEHTVFEPGGDLLIETLNGWKICPLICYDLRFPVWARNTHQYDLLIYIANWPEARGFAWHTLLRARAIENQSFVVGLNRIGMDGNGYRYAGESAAIGPLGETISEMQDSDGLLYAELSKTTLESNRTKLPFLNDMDDFRLIG